MDGAQYDYSVNLSVYNAAGPCPMFALGRGSAPPPEPTFSSLGDLELWQNILA